jgi:hypothetical protein
MAQPSVAQVYPRRDESGRVVSLGQFVAAAAGATVLGLGLLALIEGGLALVGLSDFGSASGWVAGILPGLLFFDDVRAWRGYGLRFLVALVAAAVGLSLGLFAAALAAGWPAILSGAVGALVSAVCYVPVWFAGVRWLTGQSARGDETQDNQRRGGK